MSFADRYGPWAVIAGASEGTGRAFARHLAAEGIASVLVARREAPLIALADEIRAEYRVECVVAPVDLSAADATDRIVAAVGDREIGLYINNAGADPNGARFLDGQLDDWLKLINLNVTTMVRCCHHFAGPMRARGKGGLLLVNSGACYGGGSFMAAYSASKAFMLTFAESLWADLKPHGVDVLTLVLGQTDTPAYRKLLAEKGMPAPTNAASPDDVATVGLARLPHGPIRNWGQEDDVAGYAPSSPETRRDRVLMIDRVSKHVFGE
jgi:short-subunit dehydrogenase